MVVLKNYLQLENILALPDGGEEETSLTLSMQSCLAPG